MRFLMLITAVGVGAFALVLNMANAEPQVKTGGGGASISQCVENDKFCSGKFTTNCCTEFCLVPFGKANGVCRPDPESCLPNGHECSTSSRCCNEACLFQGPGKPAKCGFL